MKKIFVLAVISIMAVCASAQDIFVGGSVGAWRNGSDKTTSITIAPEIGYNLSENWAIGTTVGYNYIHTTGINTHLFSITPYARYSYFKSGMLNLFVDGGFGLGAGKSKYEGESSDTAVTYEIGFKPGLALNITEKFSLVAHVGFLGYRGANDAATDALEAAGISAKSWGLDLSGYNLSFGLYYTF
ncbi:MAG: porin family protein [Duncaniella sp.]|nr:porin family protein [Duncaniella sp.]